MSNRITNILAVILLLFMFTLAVGSMAGDSLTMDELAHLPAGYSYLTQRDMRLNPEHPPLIKDLAAFPLLFIKNINFPKNIDAWKSDVNGQWVFGYYLLFNNNNPADAMIFWGRIPMILTLILLGFYIFRWAKELFGNNAALLALFLFALSPTFLAHGRLVTTDVGAATGATISTYYFIKFLKDKSKKNLLKAGVVLGLAELAKFSLILLLPFFGILLLVWSVATTLRPVGFLKTFAKHLLPFFFVILIGYSLVWVVYQYHTWGYPAEKQVSDTRMTLGSFKYSGLANSLAWMADKPLLRPVAQYLLGLSMVIQRASGGNNGYFLGELSAAGWKTYFPTVFAIKEALSFHILWITAVLYAVWRAKKSLWRVIKERGVTVWAKNHFAEIAMLLFIFIYWATSLTSNLNIGVRHLLPVFPFTIILAAGITSLWLKSPFRGAKAAFISLLLLWQIVSVLSVYPSFLAYFNELAGGPDNGHNYVVDSNLDWGQDARRLAKWVEEKGVNKIYVDYFGGTDVSYYLKQKYAQWWGTRSPEDLPQGSYLAISVTLLQGGRGRPAKGFSDPAGYYLWLDKYEPVAKIGNSIFVYYIE